LQSCHIPAACPLLLSPPQSLRATSLQLANFCCLLPNLCVAGVLASRDYAVAQPRHHVTTPSLSPDFAIMPHPCSLPTFVVFGLPPANHPTSLQLANFCCLLPNLCVTLRRLGTT
jgi:hypothetical protein